MCAPGNTLKVIKQSQQYSFIPSICVYHRAQKSVVENMDSEQNCKENENTDSKGL